MLPKFFPLSMLDNYSMQNIDCFMKCAKKKLFQFYKLGNFCWLGITYNIYWFIKNNRQPTKVEPSNAASAKPGPMKSPVWAYVKPSVPAMYSEKGMNEPEDLELESDSGCCKYGLFILLLFLTPTPVIASMLLSHCNAWFRVSYLFPLS